jgi:hypothetical protein
MRGTKPTVPADLESRIQAAVRAEFSKPGSESADAPSFDEGSVVAIGRRFPRLPPWGLSAAAIVVLAIGIGVIRGPSGTDMDQDPIVVAAQEPIPEAWLWDDGMVAGAPVFDGLSDEDLEALLEELEG